MKILCLERLLSVWGQQYFFCFFVLCVLKGIFLKGMCERYPLSKDERLTPATAKVMATNVIHQFYPILLIIAIFCKISISSALREWCNNHSINQNIKVQIL